MRDARTSSDLKGLCLARIMFYSVSFVHSCRRQCFKFHKSRPKISQLFKQLGHLGLCTNRLDKAELLCVSLPYTIVMIMLIVNI